MLSFLLPFALSYLFWNSSLVPPTLKLIAYFYYYCYTCVHKYVCKRNLLSPFLSFASTMSALHLTTNQGAYSWE